MPPNPDLNDKPVVKALRAHIRSLARAVKRLPRAQRPRRTAMRDTPLLVTVPLSRRSRSDASSSETAGGRRGRSAGRRRALSDLMKTRGLSEADVTAALKTYTPTGKHDEYYLFASGGHSGKVIVIGVPTMRILKYIGVFTPEPWQGYGFDDQTEERARRRARATGKTLTWGDTHHPALSRDRRRLRRPVPVRQRQGQRRASR